LRFGFPYATFTTACHFVVTYLGVLVCKYRGYYEPKKLNQCDVLSITIFFIGFVVFNNLSLNHNSVGFYQLMKVLTTPVIAMIQYLFFGETLHQNLQFALVFVICGVVMASVSDVEVNMIGSIYAALGIVSTSYYQIFVKKKQKELNASSFQNS
jgi:solute carrier family 35 protein E3